MLRLDPHLSDAGDRFGRVSHAQFDRVAVALRALFAGVGGSDADP